jgi:hypothetical protein
MNDQVINKEKILPMVAKKAIYPRQPIFFINLKSNTMKNTLQRYGFVGVMQITSLCSAIL